MPFLPTVIHSLLQIVTVGLGSPLGREVAPRELGAVVATWLAEKTEWSGIESHHDCLRRRSWFGCGPKGEEQLGLRP
jgi:H+/Cl- antiporter ClcA